MSKRKAQSVRKPQKYSSNFFRIIPFRVYSMVLITVFGVVIYSNSFDCSFHLDDFRNITENQTIRDLDNPKDITTFSYHSAMRIVGFLTFALNYHFNGLNVLGYHAVNLLIHIGASLFAWWLAFLILSTPVMRRFDIAQRRNLVALACGLLFVAHPVQTQAITYSVQHFASLAPLFYLASLCFYLKARLTADKARKILYFICFLGAVLAGMFTKEITFTLSLAVLFLEFAFVSTDNLQGLLKKKVVLYGILLFGLFAIMVT